MMLCFLYNLEFQSLLTTLKEIASTQAILLQENKEIRAQLNDMLEKQMQKLKHSKEKVIIPDKIRVNLHLWMVFSRVNTARLCQAAHAFLETGKLYLLKVYKIILISEVIISKF